MKKEEEGEEEQEKGWVEVTGAGDSHKLVANRGLEGGPILFYPGLHFHTVLHGRQAGLFCPPRVARQSGSWRGQSAQPPVPTSLINLPEDKERSNPLPPRCVTLGYEPSGPEPGPHPCPCLPKWAGPPEPGSKPQTRPASWDLASILRAPSCLDPKRDSGTYLVRVRCRMPGFQFS